MKNNETNIVVGVTGGIAAYKSPDLVRRLQEQGFVVRVVMTAGAENFITATTLQAVSGHPVNNDLFDNEAEAAMGHIELAKWADIILIAPATANCLSKIAHGLADDLLTSLILASSAQLMLAPAMNQQMWKNKAIISNAESLKQRGILLFGPDAGEQACGDVGLGRMREPSQLVEALVQWQQSASASDESEVSGILDGVKLLLTAGPTVEAIDPVRYLSNHSSGKMGYAIAEAALTAGAEVTLVSGPVSLTAPPAATMVAVKSAKEMLLAVQQHLAQSDVFIGCAAVADYAPSQVARQKIKKNADSMQIELTRNPDIIAWVGSQKERPYIVGFAAESENLEAYAKKKLQDKNLDLICANDISDTSIGFNSDNNAISIFNASGRQKQIKSMPKAKIAEVIIKEIAKNLN
ncbi:MAG: bifunctional phosphopantothenoylcysteine decarboxylase/phosphopantothenate--cysteine ligase CoaBC [Enterobacterales bacterium]|nr:bifunctional phosphopantothenoylcysteine decarboxylase/phosphopantothenate--cysteine ligase CoaBC [Enterobacterales bacterium]